MAATAKGRRVSGEAFDRIGWSSGVHGGDRFPITDDMKRAALERVDPRLYELSDIIYVGLDVAPWSGELLMTITYHTDYSVTLPPSGDTA